MNKKYKVGYIHTINGAPAIYEKGQQIYYSHRLVLKIPDMVVSSLKTIRSQQKKSAEYRSRLGYESYESSLCSYGHIKVIYARRKE